MRKARTQNGMSAGGENEAQEDHRYDSLHNDALMLHQTCHRLG
jgi:hypothetical protein